MGRLSNEEKARRAAAQTEVADAVTESAKTETDTRVFQPYVPTGENVGSVRSKTRMSFTLNADGTAPDFQSMRENQKELFRRVLQSPDAKAQLGIVTPPEQIAPMFTEQDIRALYTMLGPVEGYAFALALKCPVAMASKIFTYTEDDFAILAAPTTALCNKYAAFLGGYAKWKEEITFGMVFIAVTQKKLAALRHELARVKAEKEENSALQTNIRIVEAEPVKVQPENGATITDGFAVVEGQ